MEISIDRDSNEPIFRQVVREIRDLIRSGTLPEGFRLPPERRLADALGRTAMEWAYSARQGRNRLVLGRDGLTSGMYGLEVRLGNEREVRTLVVVVLLLLLAEACLANTESAGKWPLRNELSTRAPAQMSATKVVTGWMLSRALVDGCTPLIRISIDSLLEGLSQTYEARVC